MTNKTLSFADLNLVKKSEVGCEFEYLRGGSKPSGIFLTVVGRESERSKEWSRKSLNRIRQTEAILKKKGKDSVRDIEDDELFSNEMAAVRIIGWRGISEEYTPELALELVKINSEIKEQVLEFSDDLGNFTKSK